MGDLPCTVLYFDLETSRDATSGGAPTVVSQNSRLTLKPPFGFRKCAPRSHRGDLRRSDAGPSEADIGSS